MTNEDKELISYLKSLWIRIRLGVGIMVGAVILLDVLWIVIVLLKS